MQTLIVIALVFWNLFVSWLNAWGVGRSWNEVKAVGGWPKFLAYCTAVMSACGFTWCYSVVLGMIAWGLVQPQYHKYIEVVFEMTYLAIIVPVLGAGLAMTVESWRRVWQSRTFGDGAVAVYNTFAQFYNTYEAVTETPALFDNIKNFFSSDSSDDDEEAKLLVLLLVVLCLLAGVVTTAAIIKHTARSYKQERIMDSYAHAGV